MIFFNNVIYLSICYLLEVAVRWIDDILYHENEKIVLVSSRERYKLTVNVRKSDIAYKMKNS